MAEPTLQHYENDDSTPGYDQTAFINMPHIHPGRDKYSCNNTDLRHVMDFSWKASMILGQVALDQIDSHLDRGDALPPRAQLCSDILKRYAALKDSAKYRPFFEAFQTVKQGLRWELAATREACRLSCQSLTSDMAITPD